MVKTPQKTAAPTRLSILGIPVDITHLSAATYSVLCWARNPGAHMVFVRDVASLMAAVESPKLRALHDEASLVVPDGTPLVWLGKLMGRGSSIGRVPGADLVDAVCQASLVEGQSHFFFGGQPGVADEMAARLTDRFPGLKVAGTFSPPMRNIDANFALDQQALSEVEFIRSSNPDFIWVGISSPKQEYWMSQASQHFEHGIFFGVGAAFDFHTGRVARAPRWMRNNGLEWLHRLLSEPRRLWYRYLVLAPKFVIQVTAQLLFDRKSLLQFRNI